MTFEDLQRISPANYFYDVRDQLKRHVYERQEAALAAGDAARDAIRTREAMRRRQRAVRRQFLKAIDAIPSDHAPPPTRVTGVIEDDGFRVEKVIIESRPKVFVPANLYVPHNLKGPTAAVLHLSGHDAEGKHARGGGCIVAQHFVRAGMVVLAPDPPGQGERLDYWDARTGKALVPSGTADHQQVGASCALSGSVLTRYFLHDAVRAFDYLAGRPEVDRSRIGATGASGGGLQTALLMMAEPRLACAAPGMYLCNRRVHIHRGGAEDAEQVWPGMTAWGLDHEDFLLMMSPRPVCVLAATYDFFPIEGTRRSVERSRRFWDMHRAADRLELSEVACTHQYSPAHAKAAAEFFAKHLLGRRVRVTQKGMTSFEPRALWCTSSGQVRGELPGARMIQDENRRLVASLAPRRSARSGTAWLRKIVTASRRKCEQNLRIYLQEDCGGLHVQMGLWWSQPGLFNHAFVFRSKRLDGRTLPVTIAVWDDGGLALNAHRRWIEQTCRAGRAAVVLETTGVGTIAPNSMSLHRAKEFFGVLHTLHNGLDWLGDSLAAMRVWDVLRAVDVVKVWPGLKTTGVRLHCEGRQGVYGRLAAAIDRRITRVSHRSGLNSFAQLCAPGPQDSHDLMSVIVPGILRHVDLPQLR